MSSNIQIEKVCQWCGKTSLPGLLRLRTVPNDALNMPIRIESAKRKWNGAKKRCVEFRPG